MPTQAQKYFGYSPKSYDSYFQNRGGGQTAPPQPTVNPYGQIGNERLKLESQFRVNELLGQMDAVEQNNRDRTFRIQNQAAIEAARQQQFNNEIEALGQKQRQQDVLRRMQGIDWTNPNSRTQLSTLAQESPEAAEVVADQARMQERIFGNDLLGQRKLQEQEEANTFMQQLHPRYQAEAAKVIGAGGSLAQAKSAAAAREQDDKMAAELVRYGVPEDQHEAIRTGGFIDPVKAAAAVAKQRQTLMEQKAKAVKPATQQQMDRWMSQKIDLETELNELGGPTQDKKIEAFTKKYKRPPVVDGPNKDLEWSEAYQLAAAEDPERLAILKKIALKDQFLAGGQPQAPATEAARKVFPTKHPMSKDGRNSNVLLAGVNLNGKEYVIPTMIDGKEVSIDEAVAVAKKNGLDKYPSFKTPQEATAWAEANHSSINENGELVVKEAPKSLEFKSVEEAEKAALPKGTIVIINGRKARID